ncbi:trypsin-like peptidase domain-containing protein [Streptomyces virginiae]|uniref:nSTAND1 domain-containing NTPase n=1 Tax=Streptomyces virginiae TaxID=1961 RepID=UPI0036836EDB
MAGGLPAAVAQVVGPDGGAAGAGFLVADGLLVTCAHVVELAGGGPGTQVQLRFPHMEGAPRVDGLVLTALWRASENEDVAVVRLSSTPPGLKPLPLGSAVGCSGHKVRSYGFPAQAPQTGHLGFGEAGDLLPSSPQRGIHLQLTDANDLTTGFSGAPVLDQVTGLVIGMLTEITAPDVHQRGQGVAYVTATQTLREILPELRVQEVCPYRELEPFTAEHARWFQGRKDAVRQVVTKLAGQRRLTLLLGPSGSGKSSLVQAGVLQALAAGALPGSDRWLPVIARPRQNLLAEIERAGLPGAITRGIAAAASRRLSAEDGYERVLLVIDQFEELFTQPGHDQRQDGLASMEQITAAVGSPVGLSVILIMRDDFYPQLAALAPQLLDTAMPGLLNVPSTLSQQDLSDIITLPAQDVGLHLQPGLVEQIVTDVLAVTPDTARQAPVTVLPLLELALSQLWSRREDGYLTHEAYRRIGAVSGSLTTWCDNALNGMPPEQHPIARRILTSLVHPEDPSRNVPAVRAQLPLDELRDLAADPDGAADGHVDDVIGVLTLHRIITTQLHPPEGPDAPPGEPVAELVHDALIREWGKLREWVDQDRLFHEWFNRTRERRALWAATSDPGELLSGAALHAGLDWSHKWRLPGDIRAFLKASEQRQQAAIRRSRRLNTVLGGLLALALVAAAVAVWQWREASNERQTALSRQLAAQSAAHLEANPDLSSLLAVRAYRAGHTAEAAESLANAADLPLRKRLISPAGPVNRLVYSPDGRTMATVGRNGTALLWDVAAGRPRTTLKGHTGEVWAVAFSPDGRTLATGSWDKTVRLWDVDTGTLRKVLDDHNDKVWSVAYSPDGKTLATASSDRTVRLRDAATGRTRTADLRHPAGVAAVVFSPDGRTLATGGADKTARVWDAATGRLRTTMKGHTDTVYVVAFSPDGRTLATGGADHTARLWEVATGKPRHVLGSRSLIDAVGAVAFSPDGRTLATGSWDNAAIVWDTATGRVETWLGGHTDAVNAVSFSPDGRSLATGSFDSSVRLWDTGNTHLRGVLKGHSARVRAVAYRRDGRFLASGSWDKAVRLWDLANRTSRTLKGHTDIVDSVAFSPDGGTLASAAEDKTVRLWNVATGTSRVLRGHTGAVVAVAFGADRHTLASASLDKTVRLWDLANGTVRTFKGHTDGVLALAFSPNGRTLASGGHDNTARLWNVATGTSRVLEGHTDFLWSVAFSPDGRTLATGSHDTTARLWNVATGGHRATLERHDEAVTSVAFSPDGRTLATGSSDTTVSLWGVTDGRHRFAMGFADNIFAMAFSPDGRTLAVGSQDSTVVLVDPSFLPPDEAVRKICRAVNRDLTRQERNDYLHDQSSGSACRSTG